MSIISIVTGAVKVSGRLGAKIDSVTKNAINRLQASTILQSPDGATDVTVTGTRLDTAADVVSSVLPAGAATQTTLAALEVLLTSLDAALGSHTFPAFTTAFKTITHAHSKIHDGNAYLHQDWQDVAGAGTTVELLVQVPTGTFPHIIASYSSEAEFNIEAFEGTTFSAAGTVLVPPNNNRNSTNTSNLVFTQGPTITADGTSLSKWKLGTGGTGGGIVTRGHEIILKQNTVYLLRITKVAAGTDWIQTTLEYYE